MMGRSTGTGRARSTVRLLAAAALGLGLVVLGGAPANADVDAGGPRPTPGGPPNGPADPGGTPGNGNPYGASGPSYGSAGGCSVVSTPSYIGVSCGDGSVQQQTVREYFDVEKKKDIPGCSHQRLGQAELDALQYENTSGPEGTTWWWEYCLVDPELDTPVRQVQIHVSIVWIRNDEDVEVHTLINDLVDLQQGTVPFPVAVATPSSRPRVGAWTSFVNGTEDHLTVGAGNVTLDAHVIGLTVKPLGEDRPESQSCPGTGYIAQRGDTPETHDGCWWKYANSSSGERLVTSEGQPAYPVEITATWAVDTIVGGIRQRFNTFQKSQVTPLPVTEIQALVVS